MSGHPAPLLWLVATGLLALMVAGATYVLRGRRTNTRPPIASGATRRCPPC